MYSSVWEVESLSRFWLCISSDLDMQWCIRKIWKVFIYHFTEILRIVKLSQMMWYSTFPHNEAIEYKFITSSESNWISTTFSFWAERYFAIKNTIRSVPCMIFQLFPNTTFLLNIWFTRRVTVHSISPFWLSVGEISP